MSLICQESCNMVVSEEQPYDDGFDDRRMVDVMSMPCITGIEQSIPLS